MRTTARSPPSSRVDAAPVAVPKDLSGPHGHSAPPAEECGVSVVRVSVIVASWNTRDLLERCLRSVTSSHPGFELELIVVDNGSSDGSVQMVASRFPQAILIASKENLGFAGANNLGMARATGDYLLLINADAEMADSALSGLVHCAEENPGAGIVGPRLLNPDGTAQSSRRRFPTTATAFLESTVLQRWFPNHPVLRAYYVLDRDDGEVQEVDWLVGACLLVRAEAARSAGPLDEGYFMYSEELDWCHRFANKGWKVVYYPFAVVYHHGGQGSDQAPFHRHTRFQLSKCRYFERHHGLLFAQLLRLFILLNYLFMLGEDAAKWLLGSKRKMRAGRISVLARVVWWQLVWIAKWGRIAP